MSPEGGGGCGGCGPKPAPLNEPMANRGSCLTNPPIVSLTSLAWSRIGEPIRGPRSVLIRASGPGDLSSPSRPLPVHSSGGSIFPSPNGPPLEAGGGCRFTATKATCCCVEGGRRISPPPGLKPVIDADALLMDKGASCASLCGGGRAIPCAVEVV